VIRLLSSCRSSDFGFAKALPSMPNIGAAHPNLGYSGTQSFDMWKNSDSSWSSSAVSAGCSVMKLASVIASSVKTSKGRLPKEVCQYTLSQLSTV
jgi:hypothetical protein